MEANNRGDCSSKRRSKETSYNFKRDDSNEKLKKPHNGIIRKSLNSAFGSVSENIMLETKELVDSSPDSEINCSLKTKVDTSPDSEINCSLKTKVDTSPESENYDISSITTLLGSSEEAFGPSTSSSSGSNIINYDLEIGHVPDKVLVDFLRRQILNASDVVKDSRYKKLLDVFLNVVLIEDGLPTKPDRFSELVSAKIRIGLFCFCAWIILVSIFLFSKSGAQTTLPDPPPT